MNRRIEELIDAAKLTAVSEMFEDELVKFAELIVKECVDVVMDGDRTRRDYFADKIKKHFGVE